MNAIAWQQNGPIENGQCLIETDRFVSIELTASATMATIAPLAYDMEEETRRVADIVIAAPAALSLLRRIEPHIDAIVCYASTMDEHEPNRLAADLRALLAKVTAA